MATHPTGRPCAVNPLSTADVPSSLSKFNYGPLVGSVLATRLAELWRKSIPGCCVSAVGAIVVRTHRVSGKPTDWSLADWVPLVSARKQVDRKVTGDPSLPHAEALRLSRLIEQKALNSRHHRLELVPEKALVMLMSWRSMCGECACAAMTICAELGLKLEAFTPTRAFWKKLRAWVKGKSIRIQVENSDFQHVVHGSRESKRSWSLEGLEGTHVCHEVKELLPYIESEAGHVNLCKLQNQSHVLGMSDWLKSSSSNT